MAYLTIYQPSASKRNVTAETAPGTFARPKDQKEYDALVARTDIDPKTIDLQAGPSWAVHVALQGTPTLDPNTGYRTWTWTDGAGSKYTVRLDLFNCLVRVYLELAGTFPKVSSFQGQSASMVVAGEITPAVLRFLSAYDAYGYVGWS